jgi:ubiquinone/menaquinone biosynthesis C-methylase UbiE
MKEAPLEKPQSSLSFKIMSLQFKLRDLISPRQDILKEAGIKPGFQVLDFGCGPGGYILPLSTLTGPSGKIYALDINPNAIQAVKSLASKHQLTNIATILSDSATGLPDGNIDVVLLYDILHMLKKPDDILAELHRALKADGTLSVRDHHLAEEEITSRITGTKLFRLLRKGEKVYNFSRI